MAHCIAPEAEKILDQQFDVLDKGFVRLVDYMGSDERIVQAARVSYGTGTKTYRKDKALIHYLLRNEHTSPFEQIVFTFHIKLPIFIARQWIRHRTARLNEISGRYSVMASEFYVPSGESIAFQSENNKQGRASTPVPEELQSEITTILQNDQKEVYGHYEDMLNKGIARELARINLPLSLYTEWYWQIDLHNLFHFLKLRLDSHAQMEIRAYSEVLAEIGKKVCPVAFEAFEEHIVMGTRFSKSEMDALRAILRNQKAELDERSMRRFIDKLGVDTFRSDLSG